MIQLEHIIKEFKNGDYVTRALDDINITVKKANSLLSWGHLVLVSQQ